MLILDQLRAFREELTGDFIAGEEAQRFAYEMHAEYPAEWAEWCQAIAVQHIAIELARMERKRRDRALSPSRMFAVAAESADAVALGLFRVTFTVAADHTRRPFGQMTAQDCRYVAGNYHRASVHARMMSTFLEAVANKVKRRTVEQVLTEEQVRRMLVSLGGNGDEISEAA